MTVNSYIQDDSGNIIEQSEMKTYCSYCGRDITDENKYVTEFIKCHETNEKFIHPAWCESCIKHILRY